MFQSTHPRRVWRQESTVEQQTSSFNPHTHEGCDTDRILPSLPWQCFNPHTHTGCDTIQIAILTKFISFNPHTHTGCDYQYVYHQNQPNQFQSTHPYRVWRHFAISYITFHVFQSTHPYRVWLPQLLKPYLIPKVSIHTPIQGVTLCG